MQKFEIHINWLNVTTTVVLHTPQPVSASDADLNSLAQSDQVPWLSQTILVAKVKHLFKSRQAVVKNVLCGQDTPSGLRIVAQLSYLDSTVPFKTIILDYDDVIEAVYV